MKNWLFIALLLFVLTSCRSQNEKNETGKIVGGPCEGCEAIFEFGSKKLSSVDTLPNFMQTKPKLKLTGIVYQKDAKTPAKDVIVYIYHTNRDGNYETIGGEKGWAKRHGHIRGWAKTGPDGSYTFYTFRPAAYPDRTEPAHIHYTVKEPDISEYYIDEVVFEDDPYLTDSKKEKLLNRGGSGVVKPLLKDSIFLVDRNIVLGRNIPDYE